MVYNYDTLTIKSTAVKHMSYDKVINNLKKRGFTPFFASSAEEGVDIVRRIIPKGARIGFGGSATVEEIGLVEALKHDYTPLHRSLFDASYHSRLFQDMHLADWYIAGANALCESGEIINIDGRGNRVAEMLFGPPNILVICGTNKVVKSIDEGIDRVRNVAAPMNTRRLKKNTPCAASGACSDCQSPDTICRATVIHHHPTTGKNFFVIIIDAVLGY